jgi:Ca2+-binding EF-hand superfamily protein
MRRTDTSVLAFSTFFLAGLASAQTDVRDQRFTQRDGDRDGYLTLSEYGGHPGNFRALDRNGDNRLSRDEFVRRAGGPVIALPDEYAYTDLNEDGWLSRAEWYGRDVPFDRVDRDRDGRISRDEFSGVRISDNRQDLFYGRDSDSDGVISRREWRGESIAFGTADTNEDGVVSLREYMAMPAQSAEIDDRAVRFDELDRDQDGLLRRNEWRGMGVTFETVDRNRDGQVTPREFRSSSADDPALQFRAMDGNRDGVLTRWEWSGTRDSFLRRDRNGDGLISRSEYTSYPARVAGASAPRAGPSTPRVAPVLL